MIRAVCLLLAAGLSHVSAQSARPLTLQEALRLADQHNPQLRVGSAIVQQAEAAVLTSKAWQNPTLTFGTLGRQQVLINQGAYSGMLNGMNFTQPVELPGVRSARVSLSEGRRHTTELAVSEVRLAIHGAVRQAFYDSLRRRREMQLAKGNVDLLSDLRRRISVQVDVGEAAKLELTRAEAEVAGARIAARSAELKYSAALSDLYAAVGAPIGNVEPEGELARPQILPTLAELEQDMLAKHPSIAVAESEIRNANLNVQNERAQRIPTPSFWMDWFQQPEASQYRFGVSITLPLWNKREGPIAEALAARRTVHAQADARRVQLMSALQRAYALYQAADQQVQLAEAGSLRQAEAAVDAAEAAFRFGERGIIEVLDAQRVLRSARMDYLNAQFDRQQALIELEQLRAIDMGDTTK